MAKRTGKGSRRYPGVQDLGGGEYRVRAVIKHPKTGKRLDLDRVISATSMGAAAAERSRIIEDARGGGQSATTERKRFREYAATWMAGMRTSWSPSTRKTIAEVLDLHAIPKIGDYFLDAISEDDLTQLRDGWSKEVVPVGRSKKNQKFRPISPTTVNTRLRITKQVIHAARRAGFMHRDITENVASLAVPQRDPDQAGASLTGKELMHLLVEFRRSYPNWYPMVAVMGWTGLRFGEASELRWSDFDPQAGTLRVSRAQWHGIVGAPKTDAGARLIALAPDAIEALGLQRHMVSVRGGAVMGAALIFPSSVRDESGRLAGKHLWSSSISKAMDDVLRVIGVTRRFKANHGFRHTMNNLVRQVTTEQVRQALIGHADEASGETYTDVRLDEKRAAIAAVVQLVKESS